MSHRNGKVITPMRLGQCVLAVLTMLASFPIMASVGKPAASPRTDPVIQALIEQAAVAIVRGDADLSERFLALRESSLTGRDRVVLQLALYLEKSSGTEQSMAGALILQHMDFTQEEKLDAILPHLDTAGPELRRVFTELLGTIDRPEGGAPDFRFYEARILKDKDAPPSALIRYLYEVSPDAALATMERIYSGGMARQDTETVTTEDLQRLLAALDTGASWTTQERDRIQVMLAALSRDPGWWRRFYAAVVLLRNPDLVTPEMTKRLKSDANPLVRDPESP